MEQSYESDQEESTLGPHGHCRVIVSTRVAEQSRDLKFSKSSIPWNQWADCRDQGDVGRGRWMGGHTATALPCCAGAHLSLVQPLSPSRFLLGLREGTWGEAHPRQQGDCSRSPTWGKHEKGPAGMEPLAPSHNIPVERAGASSCPPAPKSCRFESSVI